jgi:hypothetical protein
VNAPTPSIESDAVTVSTLLMNKPGPKPVTFDVSPTNVIVTSALEESLTPSQDQNDVFHAFVSIQLRIPTRNDVEFSVIGMPNPL